MGGCATDGCVMGGCVADGCVKGGWVTDCVRGGCMRSSVGGGIWSLGYCGLFQIGSRGFQGTPLGVCCCAGCAFHEELRWPLEVLGCCCAGCCVGCGLFQVEEVTPLGAN